MCFVPVALHYKYIKHGFVTPKSEIFAYVRTCWWLRSVCMHVCVLPIRLPTLTIWLVVILLPPRQMAMGAEYKVYQLQFVVKKGRYRGVRGSAYKAATECSGLRWTSVRKDPIEWDDDDNLCIDICFETYANLNRFRNKVVDIHTSDFMKNTGLTPGYDDSNKEISTRRENLTLIDPTDIRNFTPEGSEQDFDSVVQDLANFKVSSKRASSGGRGGSRSKSSRTTTSGSRSEIDPQAKKMLDTWQSLQRYVPESTFPFQACHLIPRNEGEGKLTLKQNPDNFVGGTYEFHNGLDGTHTTPVNVPRFMLEFLRARNVWKYGEDENRRQKVCVRLVFRDPDVAEECIGYFKRSFKDTCAVDDKGTIEGVMHVMDVEHFKACLKRKREITTRIWRNTGYSRRGVLGKRFR